MCNNNKGPNIVCTFRGAALIGSLALLIVFSGCRARMSLSGSEKTLYGISADQPKDSMILAYYLPYKMNLDSQMNKVIARSAIEIGKGRPEGPLNNLMADAMYTTGKLNNIQFDVAYTNYGGLRIPLPKGNITLNNVFELMPFENLITTVKFSGADLQQFFDYVAAGGGDPISGAKFIIRDKKAVQIMINGEPFDPTRDYTLLTSDYMANGGDGGVIFSKASDRKTYQVKLRDALLTYIEKQTKEGKLLNPVNDGRISVE
jgi:2',3'-cyclic-nucleotide 2'-phosphodiesterase (5'-nucleotidase family)